MIPFLLRSWPVLACAGFQWAQAVICGLNRQWPQVMMFTGVGFANIAAAWMVQ